ncbi:MAG: sugar phosphate isomerase [Spirochaetes bacterium]|nr:sugar phosphate isomerase [Spirochaetota bacterium]
MDSNAAAARDFIEHETQFHLGALLTEQPHPKTVTLSQTTASDISAGIAMLQSVDGDIIGLADTVFGSPEFASLTADITSTFRAGGRICFSGCGATGRLSILLETMWRKYWKDTKTLPKGIAARYPDAADKVISIMTGGDFALVRSVESFEDYTEFGREQVREAGLGAGDMLVAVSEGGETSSVIGTAFEALAAGARVYFVCNNPLALLAKTVERSRIIIDEPRVTKIELASGPMAVAGSTRMQATTSELLVLGAALEMSLETILNPDDAGTAGAARFAEQYAALQKILSCKENRDAMARMVSTEAAVYRAGGAITYLAKEMLLDIFTDTTERSPTFMLPPFRRADDAVAPRSWAFVKHPGLSTVDAWRHVYVREPRCLDWTPEDYSRMGAPERARPFPPKITKGDLMQFCIGNEPDASRCSSPEDTAVMVLFGNELRDTGFIDAGKKMSSGFTRSAAFIIGDNAPGYDSENVFHVRCKLPVSRLGLWKHLAAKLVMNTVSTATMALMGRIRGNWMMYVETSNKKLIDRGTRLIAEIAGVSYDEACYALFETRDELTRWDAGTPRPSPVARTIEKLTTAVPAGSI